MTTENESQTPDDELDHQIDTVIKLINEQTDYVNAQVEFVNSLLADSHPVVATSLIVGVEYVTHSGDRVTIVHETQGRYLGLVAYNDNLPFPIWYTSDGCVDRNFDENVEQDPFDIKKVHREPDVVYLLLQNGKYTSNNCFMSYETAADAASIRGGRIIAFREIMED